MPSRELSKNADVIMCIEEDQSKRDDMDTTEKCIWERVSSSGAMRSKEHLSIVITL